MVHRLLSYTFFYPLFMRRGFLYLCVAGILLCFYSGGVTQDQKQKISYAQTLEKSGQWEEALRIYEELYMQAPGNIIVFNGLRNLCIRTLRYERALELIEDRRKRYPNDESLEVSLAQVHYKMGRQKEALTRWQEVLDRHPKQESIYQRVANAMIQERLLDEAIEVYLLGRKRIGKRDLFVFNLANLYGASIEYGKATEELLRYLETHPKQTSLIEREVLRYPKTERVIREIESRLKKAIASTSDDLGLRRILVSVYLRAEHYQKGLEAAREMERLTEEKKQGEALYRFGQGAFRSGAPGVAEKAYQEILSFYPDFSLKDQTLFGLAQSYQAQENFKEAVAAYQRIFDEFKRSPLASRALYRKGLIQRDELYDLTGAEKTFRTLIEHFPSSREGNDGRLELGGCLIAQGDLDRAEEIFQQAMDKTQKKGGSPWVRALVRLADMNYLRGRFDRVLTLLEELSTEKTDPEAVQDPFMNDGLKLRLFVEEHSKRHPESLRLLAVGELLERQRRYDQVLQVLDSLITGWPEDPIVADALYKKGEIEIQLGRFREGLICFDSLRMRYPTNLLADRALERIGWVYERMGEKQQAVEQYEALLVEYPQSFLIDEIRRRIRRIEKEDR